MGAGQEGTGAMRGRRGQVRCTLEQITPHSACVAKLDSVQSLQNIDEIVQIADAVLASCQPCTVFFAASTLARHEPSAPVLPLCGLAKASKPFSFSKHESCQSATQFGTGVLVGDH